MREERKVWIVIFVLIAFAALNLYVFYFQNYSEGYEFNFYKSEISIDASGDITEKLYYRPGENYHTLFRDFKSPILSESYNLKNYIEIKNVSCSEIYAEPYFVDFYAKSYIFRDGKRVKKGLSYAMKNEYGCGFGDISGFKSGNNYWISSSYSLKPENLFLINKIYYIKFLAYTPKNHKKLVLGENFFVDGEGVVVNNAYYSKESVVIYIPYTGSDFRNYQIISKENFEFDKTSPYIFSIYALIYLLPALIFFLVWHYFGREKSYLDVPFELSIYPKNRRSWEVCSFFNAPFLSLGNNLLSSLLLDLHRRKAISLKNMDDKIFFKISKTIKKESFDDVEWKFIGILRGILSKADKKYIRDGYVDISKALKPYSMRFWLAKEMKYLHVKIYKTGKRYINTNGAIVGVLLSLGYMFFANYIARAYLVGIVNLILMFVIFLKSSILTSHKKEYYKEYQQWQSFKRYLGRSYSIKKSDHKAVVLWEQYLVYASALGVAKKVLKELRKAGIINAKDFDTYNKTLVFSHSFASAGGNSSGGGFGGAGGGGIGGGGGGGR